MKNYAIRTMRHHEEVGIERLTALAAVLRLYPSDIDLVRRWSLTHRWFPHAFKDQVLALVMCHRCRDAHTFGKLQKTC